MSVGLARTVLSKKTAMLFKTYQKGRDFNGIIEFAEKCDDLFTAFGSPSSKFGLQDLSRDRLVAAKAAMEWFEGWASDVRSLKLKLGFDRNDRQRQFLCWETWSDLRASAYGTMEFLTHYIPGSPTGSRISMKILTQVIAALLHTASIVFCSHATRRHPSGRR